MKVGQRLYYVGRHKHERPSWVTIEKVGSRWAYLSNRKRIDIDTFYADGGNYSSPGRCYWSQDEYERGLHECLVWSELQRRFPLGKPDNITVEQIHQIAAMLDITLPSQSETPSSESEVNK